MLPSLLKDYSNTWRYCFYHHVSWQIKFCIHVKFLLHFDAFWNGVWLVENSCIRHIMWWRTVYVIGWKQWHTSHHVVENGVWLVENSGIGRVMWWWMVSDWLKLVVSDWLNLILIRHVIQNRVWLGENNGIRNVMWWRTACDWLKIVTYVLSRVG